MSTIVTGTASFETFCLRDFTEFCSWLSLSHEYVFSDFLLQEKLFPPQYLAIVVCHEGGTEIPFMTKSLTPLSDFVQRSRMFAEAHLGRDDPEFMEVANLVRAVFDKLNLGPIGFGCYFADVMKKVDGSLVVTEVSAGTQAAFA